MTATPHHPVIYADPERNTLARRLEQAVEGEVLFNRADRGRYATDASIYQIEPIGVLIPRSFDDVRAAIAICAELNVSVLPRGGGTSQCGQTTGPGLVIDTTKHLNRLIDLDLDAMTVTVEPGMVLDHLNAELKPHGVWFPVDVSTAAQCTIGGMAGNNSCGSRSIQYGNMVHNVASIDVLLADGTEAHLGPLRNMPRDNTRVGRLTHALIEIGERAHDAIDENVPNVLRRVGGYNIDIFNPQGPRPYTSDGQPNLAHLLIGSEGTLAMTRQITLKLSPLPTHKVLGVVNFDTFYDAMDATQHIVALKPAAVELVDRTMIDLALDNPAFRPTMEKALIGNPEAILLVEFAGEESADQAGLLDQLITLMAGLGHPGSVIPLASAAEQQALWSVRKAGLNIMMSMRGDGKPVSFIEDCAIPLENLAEYTRRLTEIFHQHDTSGTWYAHASVGTLHVRPILDMRRGGAEKMRAIAEAASTLVRQYKGAFSGEHGDGLVRSEWVAWQFGPTLMQAFQEIKTLFDPQGIMNPGKIVNSTKMDDTRLFRFKPDYQVNPLVSGLDWTDWDVHGDAKAQTTSAPGTGDDPSGGFAKAIEMCNNNGHCRKFDAGTMCPSYRVTGDEQHLTRGRANTLRLAMSGQLGPDALLSQEVHDALDLCVSCKGCKRECPTGVDMARMKIEVLYQRQKAHGLRLGNKLIATMPKWAPLAARFPWLFNLRDKLPGAAWLSERLLGLSARRSLPVWRKDTFIGQVESTPAEEADLVLFVDTFNNYLESENARAAYRVLTAAGYKVALAQPAADDPDSKRPLCCGRTYLSAGLIDEARKEAERVVHALAPFVSRGLPVVGLEPSCLLSLRDEFLVMGLSKQARQLAQQSFLFEEFLAREHEAGRLHLALQSLPEKHALLHGHCHQKAFDAVTPIQVVLGLVPDLDVKLIESSCCGMAGAFGYEASHYEASMKMGELSLFPAVREAQADSLIIADGTSCRHQITDGTQRHAHHVARVLERALAA